MLDFTPLCQVFAMPTEQSPLLPAFCWRLLQQADIQHQQLLPVNKQTLKPGSLHGRTIAFHARV